MHYLKNEEFMEYPMTVAGKKRLEDELNQLLKVDRESLKVELAEARALGDLKENAEYHAAKEKQSMLEGRIGELQTKLARAKVIDVQKMQSEKIMFGATVTLYSEEKDKTFIYQIVGEDEAKDNDKISYNSPLGKALIGKEEGDEVIVQAPKGDVVYEVQAVEYK
jgi:transcription elongation factor GreA